MYRQRLVSDRVYPPGHYKIGARRKRLRAPLRAPRSLGSVVPWDDRRGRVRYVKMDEFGGPEEPTVSRILDLPGGGWFFKAAQ